MNKIIKLNPQEIRVVYGGSKAGDGWTCIKMGSIMTMVFILGAVNGIF